MLQILQHPLQPSSLLLSGLLKIKIFFLVLLPGVIIFFMMFNILKFSIYQLELPPYLREPVHVYALPLQFCVHLRFKLPSARRIVRFLPLHCHIHIFLLLFCRRFYFSFPAVEQSA